METKAHQALKRLAIAFLRERGCRAVATEVQCPISRYRMDVAGYQDRPPLDSSFAAPPRQKPEPRTIVVECKQCRSDFLRDCESIEPLLELRAQINRIRESVEEHRIKRLEPQLRRGGTSLFAELDDWNFADSRLRAYREVMRKLRRIDEKLHGETKFFLMARYRLADQLYIAAPAGVIRRTELPLGWGLLECSEKFLEEVPAAGPVACNLTVAVPCDERCSKPAHRVRLLRNIAVAASRDL